MAECSIFSVVIAINYSSRVQMLESRLTLSNIGTVSVSWQRPGTKDRCNEMLKTSRIKYVCCRPLLAS